MRKDKGISDAVIVPMALVLFFGGDITALILIVKSYPALLNADCKKMEQKYDRQELTEVPLPDHRGF